MQVELAVGRQCGQWYSEWVEVPAHQDPTALSEEELSLLPPHAPSDTCFVHLMYVAPEEEDEEETPKPS